MKTFDGYKKRNLTDKDYALLAGGGHKALDTLFSALSSDTTNAIKITVGGTEKSITTDTLKTSLGLGSNAYTSTAYLPLAGGTMTGVITTTSGGSHKSIKVGNTYINAINGDLIFQNNSAIRFGGDSWDYNVWAGLKYVHSSKIIYLGLADGSAFTANSAQSNGKLYLPGIANIYTGNGTNLVWHKGNDGSGSGLDADLLDGKHNGQLTALYFSTGITLTKDNSINGLLSGVYGYINANNPTGAIGNNCILIAFRNSARTDTLQIVGAGNELALYYRIATNVGNPKYENWTAWRELLHSDNYTSYVNNYYWANIKISTISNTDTNPTFGYPTSIYSQFTNGSEIIGYIGRGSNNNNLYFGNYKNANINIFTDNNLSNCIYLKTGGNVGIGTTNPSEKLHIKGNAIATNFGVNSNAGSGQGISLYNGSRYVDTYGIAFVTTGNWGTHGYVTADWATYFTMNNLNNRGWIFRRNESGNVFSIDTSGQVYANGRINGNYYTSRVATGTQPYACTSTTLNTNLNADLLDGLHSSDFLRYVTTNYSTTINSGDKIATDLIAGIHKIHISNVEYSSILTGYDFYGSYWQLYFHPTSGYTQDIKYRATNCANWKTLLDSNNYTTYTVKKDGTGASGTWNISITGNANTVDNIHATGFLRWKGMLNIGNSAPFQAVVDIMKDTSKLNDGGLALYSYAGDEYTVLIGSRNDAARHGNALKWGYANKYLWMIRMTSGSPKSSDWEKISAGYADSAGNASYYTLGPSSTFTNVWDCNAPDRIVYSDYGSSGRNVTNAPTGWNYGTLLELGHMNYRRNGYLNLQLMWDVAHNTTNGGTLWFRCKDEVYRWAKNWCKVLTDQNYSSYALPLSGGWMDTDAQILFKGNNSSTSVYGTLGFRSVTPNGLTMHYTGAQTKALFLCVNGYQTAADNGGLAIDNDGVTIFGAGDTGSVFRVINEDNVSDGAQFLVTKSSGCTCKYNMTAANFYSSSDIRLKNNINNISKSIRSFTWKESGLKSYGLIAQEIEDEYPELVSNNDNGYKSINYTSALCMIIAKLENELDELRDRINLLQTPPPPSNS